MKIEVNRSIKIGVLKRKNNSKWAAPTFIISKRNGAVDFISDCREVNNRIKWKPLETPKIKDLSLKLEGFKHASSVDLKMSYYIIKFTSLEKYKYQKPNMELCNKLDKFQEKMTKLFNGLEYVRTCIDDLLIISNSWAIEAHINKLDKALSKLEHEVFELDAEKSFLPEMR